MPNLKTGVRGHLTFLTQDSPPLIASCGGRNNDAFKKNCLVLEGSSWRQGKLDNLPKARYWSANARLDAGVFILGGRETSSSSVFLRANSSSWKPGPRLPMPMMFGPCASPISSYSFLIVYQTFVYEFDTRVSGPTSDFGLGSAIRFGYSFLG